MSYGIPPVAGHPLLPETVPVTLPAPAAAELEGALAGLPSTPVDRFERGAWAPEDATTASGRALALAHDSNRELHFSRDEESGRIVVEVRTMSGELVRIIPDDEALELLAGKPLR